MKLAEYLEDLDPKLAGNLERAMAAVRQEFEEKLAATVERTVATAAEEAAALAREAPQAPAAPEAVATVSLDAADELRLAALDIDTATSQSEILDALSRGVLRFSSRVAIFVNRGQEVHGWSASGFGEADGKIREVSLGGDIPFPLAERLNSGAVALSSEDCELVCEALEAEPPSMGLLLPFVLGNQVVGTVYCDRLGDETFSVSALQLLTYIAGQTLETLPIRKRESTGTLSLTQGSKESDTVPTVPASFDEPAPTVEAVSEPPGEPHIEPVPLAPDGSEIAAEGGTEATDAGLEGLPAPAVDLPAPAVDIPADPAPAIPETRVEAPHVAGEESTRPGSLIPDTPPIAEASLPPAIEPSADEPPPTTEPAVTLGSTQIAPPDDLQGPGWAFTSTNEPGDASADSENEEAQRLARLLVTEIKLYNEEAVEEGRQNSNVYSRLQEDIDRSRQIFEDRIDPAVREENDYFKQALVRILAGGDPSLLGI